ncbi:hypothetical protein ATCCBAA256_14880 [Mycobacterium montefiorense]|nr:hypothetical protein ATCCBAA256_14880 [Mycobacterium montefiorense]
MRLFEHLSLSEALAEDHLSDAGGVPQVDEDDAAVVTATGYPPDQRHLLAGVAIP